MRRFGVLTGVLAMALGLGLCFWGLSKKSLAVAPSGSVSTPQALPALNLQQKLALVNGSKTASKILNHTANAKYSEAWFRNETHAMNRIDNNPLQTEAELLHVARTLTLVQQKNLLRKIFDPQSDSNEINLAFYLLENGPTTPASFFKKIATFNHPSLRTQQAAHSPGELVAIQWSNLTLGSFQALQERAVSKQVDSREFLKMARAIENKNLSQLSLAIHTALGQGRTLALEAK